MSEYWRTRSKCVQIILFPVRQISLELVFVGFRMIWWFGTSSNSDSKTSSSQYSLWASERVSQSVTEVALELLVKLKREFYLNKMSPFWKFSRIQVWPLTSESAFVGRSPNFVPFLLISEEALDMLTSLAGQALAYSDFSSAAFQLSHKYFPMLDIQNCMFRLSSSWMTQLFGFSICCVVTGYMKNMKIKL